MVDWRRAVIIVALVLLASACQVAFPIHEGSGANGGSSGAGGAAGATASDCSISPGGSAALPAELVDTSWVNPIGTQLNPKTSAELEQALSAVQPGDEIVLDAGAVYAGSFTLPFRAGSDWITIRSSGFDGSGAGTRVDKTCAGCFATIEVPPGNAAGFNTEAGAHHIRLVGLEIRAGGVQGGALVQLGNYSATSRAGQSHDLIVDRCYVHGTKTDVCPKAILLQAWSSAVVDSVIEDVHRADSGLGDALTIRSSGGPVLLRNNEIIAFWGGIALGVDSPQSAELEVSDVTICHNHLHRDPATNGSPWTMRSLVQIGGASRTLLVGNVLEQTWKTVQPGYAILFQDGASADVTIAFNRLSAVAGGIQSLNTQERTRYLHNSIDVTTYEAFSLLGATTMTELDFRHNTLVHSPYEVMHFAGPGSTGAVLVDNIIDRGKGGVGSDVAEGKATIDKYLPGATFSSNAIAGGSNEKYPADNFFPGSLLEILVDPNGDYHVKPESEYAKNASDGSALGADIDAIDARVTGVVK
jgi:hypothetical protein